MEEDAISGTVRKLNFNPLAVTQWNLLAVCLFFATGHWLVKMLVVCFDFCYVSSLFLCMMSLYILCFVLGLVHHFSQSTSLLIHASIFHNLLQFSGALLMAFAMGLLLLGESRAMSMCKYALV